MRVSERSSLDVLIGVAVRKVAATLRGWGWSECLQRLMHVTPFYFAQRGGSWLQHT